MRSGDIALAEHMQKCHKNASYLSKTIQHELIECCGSVITGKLLSEIKTSKFFSIIADEAANSSNKEQLSLVIRFVDEDCNIREDFLTA